MDIFSKAVIAIWDNKEWGTLLGILIFSAKQYTLTRVQQATCNGKFNEHELKIENVKEIAEESKETSKKAFHCVSQINKKVDTISESVNILRADYTKYLDDKHSKSLTNQED